ncbi:MULTISPECIES: hybrid sensor histidine kinase/response regulator [Roseomonadaceae]|uniref:histidine kinase n=1 Tax=Falsiroseomonas oleicola TaxID=2801474 RepID=A0ABS6H3A3_9PROT|nr:PAS domain S-box protein [Roseomonas oleicola]MBU8543153.1 PAS domain S-box protein [Roseomonas oleicola]
MTRILIVDDRPDNLYLLRALLEGNGFTVQQAENGLEALRLARADPPGLIVSDLMMPVLDGYSMLRRWRADPRLREIPFIVFTATYTTQRDERLAMAMGADAFLLKPMEPEAMLAAIRRTLAQREEGQLPSRRARPQEDRVLLQEYNQVLLQKLEEKVLETEHANLELRREVAERERAETRLRDSETRFRATFEQAAIGIAHIGLDRRFLWVNDRICAMTGYRREELLGLSFTDLSLPEDIARDDAARQAMLDGSLPRYNREKRYRRKDGSLIWVELVSTPVRDEQDAPRFFVTVFSDITDRKQAEDSLRQRDRAIQVVSQGIVMADARQPEHPIIYVSAGFERMTGYSAAEALGRNCRMLQGAETDRETVARLREAIAAARPIEVEIVNYRKDGTPFWNALSLNPVRDEDGTLAWFVGVQTDITERKRLERELLQAQKMEAVGRLAGGIAHDFNNHLTVITGYSEEILAHPRLEPAVRESITAIARAGDRAAELTRQLLGFSRQTMLQPKVIDLNQAVTETGRLLQRLIGADIAFGMVLAPDLARVRVDPAQLDQVLMNLAVNARDSMPQGGRLTIETANVTISEGYATTTMDCRAGPHVMLAMSDTGAGMRPEVQARIFEPFFTTKEIGKGTGLGLATVFGIVQQSQGCIHVYSEPGLGSTFKIYLPAVMQPPDAPSRSRPAPAARGQETVLLVEDDEGVRKLAQIGLGMKGYKVICARDGAEALAMAEEAGPIDLVLTDVVMPRLGGPELVRALRARHPTVKVLFMSGYTDDSVVRHGLMDASVAFIQKPYTPRSLAAKVREVLDTPLPAA